ncbi:MAG: class I SAM-dependent methyltransferase [Acidovorax sp.]
MSAQQPQSKTATAVPRSHDVGPIQGFPVLSAVPSTLRIPLAARAGGEALFPQLRVGDAVAAPMLAAMGDDGALWLRDRHSVYGILARTRRFRELAIGFLAMHPDAQVVNLGCGLSHYFQWLDNGRMRMVDADLAEVLAIRRSLLPSTSERHVLHEVDLASPDWWASLGLPDRRQGGQAPLFLMSEGVLMYLEPSMVRALLAVFGERAPAGSVLVFDAMCWLAAGRAKRHRSVKHTQAQFRWGPRHLTELTAVSPRLRLAATYSVMESYGLPFSWLGPAFRAIAGVPFYALYELHVQDSEE